MSLSRAGALTVGATGFTVGLLRLTYWWVHRKDGPGVGYLDGEPMSLVLVTIDGKPVESRTADAYLRMCSAAAADGVKLKVASGFRTMAEQEHFFECYQSGECNDGHYAQRPGYSEHQSGRALDLNTRTPGVQVWLLAHAREYGFYATVPGEPWHWEYWESPPFWSAAV